MRFAGWDRAQNFLGKSMEVLYCILPYPEPLFQSYIKGSSGNVMGRSKGPSSLKGGLPSSSHPQIPASQ